FSGPLDPTSVNEEGAFACKIWGLKRSANYGSEHVNEHRLEVRRGTLDPDGPTLRLEIPEIGPTWGMEIRYSLRSSDGRKVQGMIHNTIHTLGSETDGG
ncbi:MAG: hypothetical protein NT069_09555, partial [Planctomycetota bacterium]|nr:hypothetical protein [Planctomycetota bacterium]